MSPAKKAAAPKKPQGKAPQKGKTQQKGKGPQKGKSQQKGKVIGKGKNAKKVVAKPIKKKSWKSLHKHLFSKTPRNFGIGRAIAPKRDLTHFTKWPRYVRLQRQRAILKLRLKVPPAINHLAKTLDRNPASTLFRLLSHYRPESVDEKKARLMKQAKAEAKGAELDPAKKPKILKFGLNHITDLVESKKAKLVVIAHDVDPVELVVWLPALCRQMDVPYVIVKGKARLGRLVHLKTCSVVALTDVKKEHVAELEQFVANSRPLYNDSSADRKKWGGGILGPKALAERKRKEKAKAQAKPTA